jgi:hypothetical protein
MPSNKNAVNLAVFECLDGYNNCLFYSARLLLPLVISSAFFAGAEATTIFSHGHADMVAKVCN